MNSKRRVMQFFILLLSFAVLLAIIQFSYFGGIIGITGFAVFEDIGAGFNSGSHAGTEYNGSSVILYGENLTGNYTSRVFDANIPSMWNNISLEFGILEKYDSFLDYAIHQDSNVTDVYVKDGAYYSADMKDSSKNFYLNFSENLANQTILKFYARESNGVAIGIYAQSDTSGSNPLGIFTVNSLNGDWHNASLDLESSTEAIWIGEGAGSGTDPKDEFDYIFAEVLTLENITYQVRNCTLPDCSDGIFRGPDGTQNTYFTQFFNDLNSIGRYFQYRIYFSTGIEGFSPYLERVLVDYTGLSPVTEILSPNDSEVFNYNSNIPLNFSITNGTELSHCWYTLDEGESNISVPSCENTAFGVSDDGNYKLDFYANDSNNLIGTDSVNFTVIANGVLLTLSEPSGTKTSRTGIPIEYTVAGSNLTCRYNVRFSTGGQPIFSNDIIIPDCENSEFNLSQDGDFIFTLDVNNSLGVTNSSNSSFSVDTSSGGSSGNSGGGGSSGGGGGGSFLVGGTSGDAKLEFFDLNSVNMRRGQSEIIGFSVLNSGSRFLNDCRFLADGKIKDWISGRQVESIASGERADYLFNLNVPQNAESGRHTAEILINCNELNASSSFSVDVALGDFSFVVLSSQRDGTMLVVDYKLDELSGRDQEITLNYKLLSDSEVVLFEREENVLIEAGKENDLQFSFELPKNSVGNLKLVVSASNGRDVVNVEQEVFLTGAGLTGLQIFEVSQRNISIAGIILFSLIALFFVVRFIVGHHKRVSRDDFKGRQFIKIKLNE